MLARAIIIGLGCILERSLQHQCGGWIVEPRARLVQCRGEISKGQNVGSRDAAEGTETFRNVWMERTNNTSDGVDMQPCVEEEDDL